MPLAPASISGEFGALKKKVARQARRYIDAHSQYSPVAMYTISANTPFLTPFQLQNHMRVNVVRFIFELPFAGTADVEAAIYELDVEPGHGTVLQYGLDGGNTTQWRLMQSTSPILISSGAGLGSDSLFFDPPVELYPDHIYAISLRTGNGLLTVGGGEMASFNFLHKLWLPNSGLSWNGFPGTLSVVGFALTVPALAFQLLSPYGAKIF